MLSSYEAKEISTDPSPTTTHFTACMFLRIFYRIYQSIFLFVFTHKLTTIRCTNQSRKQTKFCCKMYWRTVWQRIPSDANTICISVFFGNFCQWEMGFLLILVKTTNFSAITHSFLCKGTIGLERPCTMYNVLSRSFL